VQHLAGARRTRFVEQALGHFDVDLDGHVRDGRSQLEHALRLGLQPRAHARAEVCIDAVDRVERRANEAREDARSRCHGPRIDAPHRAPEAGTLGTQFTVEEQQQ